MHWNPSIVCLLRTDVDELILVEMLHIVAPSATVTVWKTGLPRPSVGPPSVVLVHWPRVIGDEQMEVVDLWRRQSGSKVLTWLMGMEEDSGDELARTQPDAWLPRPASLDELRSALSGIGIPVEEPKG